MPLSASIAWIAVSRFDPEVLMPHLHRFPKEASVDCFRPDRDPRRSLEIDRRDWINKELVIDKAVSKTKVSDGARKWGWEIGQPKSRKSNRRVAAPEAVLELLRRLRAGAKNPSGLVFVGPDGKRMDPDYFDEFVFGRISTHAGLSRVRDLRDLDVRREAGSHHRSAVEMVICGRSKPSYNRVGDGLARRP
jgi:hypothetical protein